MRTHGGKRQRNIRTLTRAAGFLLACGSLVYSTTKLQENSLVYDNIHASRKQSLKHTQYTSDHTTFAFGRQRDKHNSEVVLYSPQPRVLTPSDQSEDPILIDPLGSFIVATTPAQPVIYDLALGTRVVLPFRAPCHHAIPSPGLEAILIAEDPGINWHHKEIYHKSGKLMRSLGQSENALMLHNHILIGNDTGNGTDVSIIDTHGERPLLQIPGTLSNAWHIRDKIYTLSTLTFSPGTPESIYESNPHHPRGRVICTFRTESTPFIRDNLIVTCNPQELAVHSIGPPLKTIQRVSTMGTARMLNTADDGLSLVAQDNACHLYFITPTGIRRSATPAAASIERLLSSSEGIIRFHKHSHSILARYDLHNAQTTPLPTPWEPHGPDPLYAMASILVAAAGFASMFYGLRFTQDRRDPMPASVIMRVLSIPVDAFVQYPTCFAVAALFGFSSTPQRISQIYQAAAQGANPLESMSIMMPHIVACATAVIGAKLISNMMGSLRTPRLQSLGVILRNLYSPHDQDTLRTTLSHASFEPGEHAFLDALLTTTPESSDTMYVLLEQGSRRPPQYDTPIASVIEPLLRKKTYAVLASQLRQDPHNLSLILRAQSHCIRFDRAQEAYELGEQALDRTNRNPGMLLLQGRLLKAMNQNASRSYLHEAAETLLTSQTSRIEPFGDASHAVHTILNTAYTSRTFAYKEHATLDEAILEEHLTELYDDHLNTTQTTVAQSVGTITHLGRPYIVTTYLPGPSFLENIQSGAITHEDYTNAAKLLSQLHAITVNLCTPRDIRGSLAAKTAHLGTAHVEAMDQYASSLDELHWRPNQDYHPMNLIETTAGIVKIDAGSAHQSVPVTFDIASLVLFDPNMSLTLLCDLVKTYCEASGSSRDLDTYVRGMIPALYYRSLYMSSLWDTRQTHRELRRPVLTNASRLIRGLASTEDDSLAANLLSARAASLD